ncbi:MAG TPA: hypothetical protein VMB50_01255 [Myxococcales bacterium]|nr:hypothetical protein [Myxococcales bacterium]
MVALPSSLRRAAVAALLALAACSSTPLSDGGSGTTGGGPTTGGGTSGPVFHLPDAGPPTAAEICQWLWAGSTRFGLIFFDPALLAASSQAGPYCPSPTPVQKAALAQQAAALAPEILSLTPPDGGWPDGSGPNVCDDPTSAVSTLAAQIAQAVATGGAAWNAHALTECAQGLAQSGDLVAYLEDAGGSFPGEAQVFGADGGGPCYQLLQGKVADGGSCLFGFECAGGLYCRSTGAGGSCAGNCAPLVRPGGACGPLDECAGNVSCVADLCGGPDAGPTHTGAPRAPCTSSEDCQSCLLCNPLTLQCQTGLATASCTGDYDCDTPLLYCGGPDAGCLPAVTVGEPCAASGSASCLDGWCDPIALVCRPISALGGPCASSADCLAGYCRGATAAVDGTCTPFPATGQLCGAPPLSYDCADPGDYCNLVGVQGTCAALPGLRQPCAAGECAAGLYCGAGDAGCETLPGLNESCTSPGLLCHSPYVCNASDLCVAQLPGGASCTQSSDCLSDDCSGGVCTSPCTQLGYGSNLLLSLFLGLGGAS